MICVESIMMDRNLISLAQIISTRSFVRERRRRLYGTPIYCFVWAYDQQPNSAASSLRSVQIVRL